MKAIIRGIYSTALTKPSLNSDFEIVQSSQLVKARFQLSENLTSPELRIEDKYNLQRIDILGKIEASTRIDHKERARKITNQIRVDQK